MRSSATSWPGRPTGHGLDGFLRHVAARTTFGSRMRCCGMSPTRGCRSGAAASSTAGPATRSSSGPGARRRARRAALAALLPRPALRRTPGATRCSPPRARGRSGPTPRRRSSTGGRCSPPGTSRARPGGGRGRRRGARRRQRAARQVRSGRRRVHAGPPADRWPARRPGPAADEGGRDPRALGPATRRRCAGTRRPLAMDDPERPLPDRRASC